MYVKIKCTCKTLILLISFTSLKHNFTLFQLLQVSCALRFYFNFHVSRTYNL